MNKIYLILFSVMLTLVLIPAGVTADTPTISTLSCDGITASSCTFHGNLQKNGGSDVTDVGFLYGTSESNLAYSTSEGSRGHSYGSYSSAISGLAAGTTYYYRAYAVNQDGTAYGPVMSFTTKANSPGPFDISAPYQNRAVNAEYGVTAQWSAAPGASGYRITLRDMTMNTVCFSNMEMGSSTSYSIPSENFTPGHEYSLSICAYSDAGQTCQERSFSIQTMNGATTVPTNASGSLNQNTNQYKNSQILELIVTGKNVSSNDNYTEGMSMYQYTFTVRTNTDTDQVCLFLHNGANTSMIGVNSSYATNGLLTQTREFTFTQTMLYEQGQNLSAEACVYYDGQPIQDRVGAYKQVSIPAPGEGTTEVPGNTNQFMEQIMNFFRNMFSWNVRGNSAD